MSDTGEALRRVFPESESQPWYPAEILLDAIDGSAAATLTEKNLNEYAGLATIPVLWVPDLIRTSRLILSREDLLTAYLVAVHLLTRERAGYDARLFRDWPDPAPLPEEDASRFFLLVSLACIPCIRRTHTALNIPETVSRETCSGIGSKAEDYYFFNGRPGMVKRSMYWFQHFIGGELFRIGRLEYMVKQAEESLHVYRHPGTLETRVLIKSPDDGSWISPSRDLTTRESASPGFFTGWRLCLGPEDTVLDIHIPGGGGLTLDSIHDSFVRAIEFYSHFKPDLKIRGFECMSWIISPDLEGAFTEDSNLMKFRRKVYLFPVKTGKVEGLSFIFGTNSKDPRDWPEKTSVQRRLKLHLLQGGSFRLAGMIYLTEDLHGFLDENISDPYRSTHLNEESEKN